MELDDKSIKINYLKVNEEIYAVVEDDKGEVVIEGYTSDCRR